MTMDGTQRRPPRSRLPWGLLGMIALVIAAEGAVTRHADAVTRPEGWDWWLSGRAARGEAAGSKVLCFGDSLVKYGLQPRVLEARLGRPVRSLALSSGSAPSSYFLLKRALDGGARPEAVIVDFAREILDDGPLAADRPFPWGELLSPREALELAGSVRNAEALGSILANRLFPSLRARFTLRGCVLAALRGEGLSMRAPNATLRRNWAANKGAQLNPRNPQIQDFAAPPGAEAAFQTWRCDPVNARYVRKFLDLAASRRIAVVWLITPIMPGLQATVDRGTDDARYDAFVRRMLARHPDVVVVDGRHANFPASVFIDVVHLDRRGAFALSDGVARVVGPRLAAGAKGPAWLPLPSYGDRPEDVPLEDVAQSSMVRPAPGDAVRR